MRCQRIGSMQCQTSGDGNNNLSCRSNWSRKTYRICEPFKSVKNYQFYKKYQHNRNYRCYKNYQKVIAGLVAIMCLPIGVQAESVQVQTIQAQSIQAQSTQAQSTQVQNPQRQSIQGQSTQGRSIQVQPLQPWRAETRGIEQLEQLEASRLQQEAREERLGQERTSVDVQDIAGKTMSHDNTPGRLHIQKHQLSAPLRSIPDGPSFYVSHIRIVEEPIGQQSWMPHRDMRQSFIHTSNQSIMEGSDKTSSTMDIIAAPMGKTVFVDNSVAGSTRLIKGPLYEATQKQSLQLDVPQGFMFLRKSVIPYMNRRLSLDDINELSSKLNTSLIHHGYITSRISIPPQSLASGQLQFNLQIGRIESVIYTPNGARVPWQNAFPIREGDILHIRNIEQGIEQMNRVGSQHISVELMPGTQPLSTNIVLNVTKKPPIHGMVALDDSGLTDTGKLQWTAAIGIDRLFNANDMFQLSVNRDGAQDGYVKGTKSHSVSYSIPRGKDTFTLWYSNMGYHQTIYSMTSPFISSSRSKTIKGTWHHVFHRDRTTKRSWHMSIFKRNSRYYINDVEIGVQRTNTAAVELGVSERRYIGANTLFSRAAIKKGVGWFGSQPEYGHGAPSTRYTQLLVDIDYQLPRTWAHRPASITTSLHGQWTMGGKQLYSRDMISIGNRYTVQGFDGEHTLMAESGWYVRNEVASYIPKWHSSIYANLDFGAVYGPSTDVLPGKFIVGTALGMRGQFTSGLFYDVFVGTPIYKPSGYRTDSVTTGFQVGLRF